MSRMTAAHSITKMWDTEVSACRERSRRHRLPSAWMVMSIAAWPSIDPARPLSAWARAASSSRWRRNRRNSTASRTIMIGPPMNSASVNCQPISRARMMPSSTTRLVEAISKAIAAVKLAPLAEQRPGQRHGGVGARGGGRAEPGRERQRPRPVVAQPPDDRGAPHHGLHHGGQGEAEDQRPEDLPGHRPADGQRMTQGMQPPHGAPLLPACRARAGLDARSRGPHLAGVTDTAGPFCHLGVPLLTIPAGGIIPQATRP